MTQNTKNTVSSIELLPHGSVSKIAMTCGVSRITVYKVLRNIDTYSGNQDTYAAVIKEATSILNKREETIKEVKGPFIKALQGCKI